MVRLHRLFFKDVERGGGDTLALQRFIQITFMDNPAPGTIHNHDPRLHRGDRLRIDEALGLRRQRRVDRDDICTPEEFIQRHHSDAHLLRALFRQIGIVGDDAHADPLRQLREMAADLPDPDDAEHFVEEFNAHEFVFFPLPGLHGGGGLGNTPAHRPDHRHRVFGRRDGIAARRIHHHDAPARRCRRIDVIQARAGPPDDFQLLGGGDKFCRDLRSRPDDQAHRRP